MNWLAWVFWSIYSAVRRWLLGGQMDISCIAQGLYQGGTPDALPVYIQAVVDMQLEHEDVLRENWLKALYWFPIYDSPPFPGVVPLDQIAALVLGWRGLGWTVLIHCKEGVSRSGMVMCAVLMRMNNWNRDRALEEIKKARPQAQPNPAFMAGLLQYQDYLGIAV